MGTEILPLSEIGHSEVAAWRDLAAQAAEPNPFYEPEFVLPAWRRLRLRGVGLRVVRDGGEWIACVPVQMASAANALVLTLWHPYILLSTPLIRGESVAAGARELLAPRRRHRAGVVGVRRAAGDGPVDRALAAAESELGLRRVWERRTTRAAARPVQGPRRRRRELNGKRRRLEEALGAPLTVEDRAGSAEAVEEFLRLESAGWKGRAGTALANNPQDRAFFVDMLAEFAARDQLRLTVMSAGSRTVAMDCALLDRDVQFGFRCCHDEGLRRFAPGIQLFDVLLRQFDAEDRMALFDACSAPDAKMLNEMYGDRREIVSFMAVPRELAGPVRLGLKEALVARERIRELRSVRAQPEG